MHEETIVLNGASVSEARPCSSVVKNFGGGAVGVRALPRGIAAIAAVAGRRALPVVAVMLCVCVARAADIVLVSPSAYDGRQPIVLDAAWFGGAADGAMRVEVVDPTNGVTYLTAAAGEREVVWNPSATGQYRLKLQKRDGEAWTATGYARELTVDGLTTATADDIELNLLAPGEAVADDTFVDIALGTRTNAVVRPITYSSEWTAGADGVKIFADGVLVFEGTGGGTTDWEPETNGTYVLTHRSFAGAAQTGTDLTATFFVTGLAQVTSATARQRYPWNGMVDIAFTITGDAGTAYRTTFAAKDVAGGTNLVMETVWEDGKSAASSRPPYQLTPGNYRFVWNAGADLPDGTKLERVAITVEAK